MRRWIPARAIESVTWNSPSESIHVRCLRRPSCGQASESNMEMVMLGMLEDGAPTTSRFWGMMADLLMKRTGGCLPVQWSAVVNSRDGIIGRKQIGEREGQLSGYP